MKVQLIIFVSIAATSLGMFFLRDANQKRKDSLNVMIVVNAILAYAVLAHPILFRSSEAFDLIGSFRDFVLTVACILAQVVFIVLKGLIAFYKK